MVFVCESVFSYFDFELYVHICTQTTTMDVISKTKNFLPEVSQKDSSIISPSNSTSEDKLLNTVASYCCINKQRTLNWPTCKFILLLVQPIFWEITSKEWK